MNRGQRHFLRDLRAAGNLDVFFISAICAVLAIRFFLRLTGYPQLGGAGLHIAHMLWGGLLMLAGFLVVLSFLTDGARRFAAILGGFGFGTFIDEIGKFVTRDNDYFFRPTAALIYVVLVLGYVAGRTIHGRSRTTPLEFLVNALREMEAVAQHDLDVEEQRRALRLLERSDPGNPLVPPLRRLLHETMLAPRPEPGTWMRVRVFGRSLYGSVAARPLFHRAVIGFFVVQQTLVLARAVAITVGPAIRWPGGRGFPLQGFVETIEGLSAADRAELASAVIAAGLALAGIIRLRRSRLAGFRMFERSLLVSILLTQIFTFYRTQFLALVGLAVNIVVLVTIRYGIGQEIARREAVKSSHSA